MSLQTVYHQLRDMSNNSEQKQRLRAKMSQHLGLLLPFCCEFTNHWKAWDVHFWRGMVYLALDQEEEARRAIEQALALEMPLFC
jgi:hypothetical protein